MNSKVEKIWKSFYPELKAFIIKRTGETDIADDMLQEVFVKYLLSASTVNDPAKIKPWLYQVTRNLIADPYREMKQKRLACPCVIQNEKGAGNSNDDFLTHCMIPVLEELPEKYKKALKDAVLNKGSQIQLAQQTGISYSGAKSRVQRGKSLLKTLVSQKCHPATDLYGNIIGFDTCSTCKDCSCY